MIFCYLLEKSKSCLSRVKWASKSVKRLKITAINKETIWKRLSAILYTHGYVVYSQMVLLWWRHRFQIVSFSPSTLGTQRFQTVPFSNRSTLESVFETIRFRTVVVWTVAVPGTKQYRFRLKTVQCGPGHRRFQLSKFCIYGHEISQGFSIMTDNLKRAGIFRKSVYFFSYGLRSWLLHFEYLKFSLMSS